MLFDEFQELVSDPAVRELTRRLLAQGRAANVHVLMGTQHPTIDAFGDDGGRIGGLLEMEGSANGRFWQRVGGCHIVCAEQC